VEEAGLSEPFVLVHRLLDHAIVYQVFGLLEDTTKLLTARSRLRRAIVATLHGVGIEIVSPGFVNRVEYPADRPFIPEGPSENAAEGEESEQTSAEVEAIAFDKAEEAESIERLYALQEERDTVAGQIDQTAEIVERREAEAEEREREE
jgi:small conductance mechanosensitive channel